MIYRDKEVKIRSERSELSTGKKDFYSAIISELKTHSNLTKIRAKLGISKENLNRYLKELKKRGVIKQEGRGWYELLQSEFSTKYGKLLSENSVRGHAYVWNIKLTRKIEGWDRRLDILKAKGHHFELVGALKTTPRIKVLGRKIWLCNDHIRVFDKPLASYYGATAKESKNLALNELMLIVAALEKKLGVFLRPFEFTFQKEHYALIKNELAIQHNRQGEILRVSDEEGEWLLIDDSLGEGGELETIGKKAYTTNIPLQKWWNDQKKTSFEVTPTFILNTMNGIQQNQLVFAENMKSHINAIQELASAVKELRTTFKQKQTRLGDFV